MTGNKFNPSRRAWLTQAAALALAGCADVALLGTNLGTVGDPALDASGAALGDDTALLDDLQRRTFNFFWETANPDNGLVPDRWPSNPRLASIASVGFALTAYVVGVEEGLVSRVAARKRVLNTARFFANAPQGPQASGMAGHQGFFYHFLDMQTGHRFNANIELSTIDTSLLLAGLLCAQAYFDGDDADEVEIRALVGRIYGRVNWPWAQQRGDLICMGWKPGTGFKDFIDYTGFDEAMLMVLLALGSPTYPVAPAAWAAFTRTYSRNLAPYMGQPAHLGAGAPLFWHQYSHVWVDFKGLQDPFMRQHGSDYFENSRRATLAQQAYAVANPLGWNDYGATVWGLTACDGPGNIKAIDYRGRPRQFYDYLARAPHAPEFIDDGTIAPTAALSSLPFAPELVLPTLRALRQRFGAVIYGQYGFVDAFNTSFRAKDAKLSDGRYADGFGWVDTDYIGIDQGPIIAMVANHRHGTVWKTMRTHPALRLGLRRAGFTGGWLETT